MQPLLRRIRDTIVLPGVISAFEDRYVRRANRIALAFFAMHLPVFALVALLNDTGPLLAVALTGGALLGPFLAHRSLANPRHVSIVFGFTAMLMGALLVHFGQGPVQIEMHFYFFALIAMLALFGNPAVILTAAVTVALHHLALWYLLPSSVFNYDAPIWVVLVHAAFVVLESVATIFIARSFFDNVIGLEKIVDARTRELDARNQEMRLVLDNVDQGLLMLDAQGRMLSQKSAAVERWLGACPAGQSFAGLLEPIAPETAMAFEVGFEQATSGILPIDVCLDQFPTRTTIGDRELSLAYTPILSGDTLVQLLAVITDVTAIVERERLEVEQREAMQIFDRVLADRGGFVEFFEEADDLVTSVRSGAMADPATLKRALHTLKGNTMVFGVQSIADVCHEMETGLDETGEPPGVDEREQLGLRWDRLKGRVAPVFDARAERNIEIAPADYERLLGAALRQPTSPLAHMIAELKLEATARRLERIAEQAKRIARRLGKGDIEVRIDDHMLRLDPRRWSAFWSAFVHVVRNAVDHGLESPTERELAGKSKFGVLALTTARDGEHFSVALTDDGRGIDWDSVRARALALGLPGESRADLEAALFSDGLSTAAEITEFSGRGVGLGAVRQACLDLGGEIVIRSIAGQGTTLEFRFPERQMAPAPIELLSAVA
jgi:two-component system chemotaxis sensor kinase CheA